MSFQRKAVEEFHSRQAAVDAQPHGDRNLPHAQALSSSVIENESRSNTTAAINNAKISSGDDMDDADEQPSQRMLTEIFSHFSEVLTFVVVKRTLVRFNTASSLQTKRTASVVINGDMDNEDIQRLFSHLSPISL